MPHNLPYKDNFMPQLAFLVLHLLLAHQKPATVGPDLSTPEHTVRSFITAMFNGEVKKAVMCVYGATLDPRLDALDADVKNQKAKGGQQDTLNISSISVKVEGDTATADVKYAPPVQQGMALEEKISLKRSGTDWKIVPLSSAELAVMAGQMQGKPGAAMPPVTVIASSITNYQVLFAARERARAVSCLSNVKQVSLAMLMYLQDYDEKFKLRADSYKAKLMPYCKNEQIFHCPADKSGAVSYSFNLNLQGKSMSALKYPAQTVMIYEGRNGKLEYRHDGTAIVGFADGHAKAMNAQGAAKIRWMP
jgi:prepilin-type processing-associated H-X9-DG protein